MKKIISVVLAAFMLMGVLSTCVLAEQEIKVYINGEEVVFDTPPVLVNERTMVPMRAIFEKLGATVTWNEEFQRVEGLFENRKHVMLYVGKNIAYVDGELKVLDASPYLKDMRTMVPIRFVAEGSGAAVKWDDATWSVHITPAYLTGDFIPFGEYMSIPSPLSADANFALLDYYKENGTSYYKFDLTKVEADTVAEYEQSIIKKGFEPVKGTIGDIDKIFYSGTYVITTSIADGVYSLSLYEDASGSTISEYIK